MNVLVLINYFYPFVNPTAKVALNILRFLNTNSEMTFDVVSRHNGITSKKKIDNITNYFVKDVKKSLFERAKKKFTKHGAFILDDVFMERGAEKLIKKKKYDAVLAFSGGFNCHEIAYKLSLKNKLKLFLFYTDPFITNFTLKDVSQEQKNNFEERWLLKANAVFMPSNYFKDYKKIYARFSSKIIVCELPGFISPHNFHNNLNRNKQNHKSIIYSGYFLKNVRTPFVFLKLAEHLSEYHFYIYGEFHKKEFKIHDLPKNVTVHRRISNDKYLKILFNADLLFIEDNIFPNQIPFKVFEYVSMKKPIIFSTNNLNSDTSLFLNKYPSKFYLEDNHQSFLSCIKWISTKDVPDFDINELYFKFTTNYIGRIILNGILNTRTEE